MRLALHIIASAAAAAGPQADLDQEIQRYDFVCTATLALSSGEITASRTLDEATGQLSADDSARWNPARYNGYSINWNSWPRPTHARLPEIPGTVQFYFRSEKRLPRAGRLIFQRLNNRGYDELVTSTGTNGDRKLTSAILPLRVLLAYAGQDTKLGWMIRAAKSDIYERDSIHLSGSIDASEIREAADAIKTVSDALDRQSESPEKNCKRTPIYYNPDAEI